MKKFILTVMIALGGLQMSASSPRYLALADSADNYIRRERWEKAEETILKALRLEPGNFSNSLLLSNLGIVQTNQGKLEEALESFRLGLSISPRSSVIRTNRARTLLQLGRYDEALADLNETLAIDSIQEWPLQVRGRLLISTDPAEAQRNFETLQRHYPSNPASRTGLAAIAEKEGNGEEALRLYAEALKLEDDPDTRFMRILLEINMNRYSEASEEISDAIKDYPNNGDFHLLRGLLHRLQYRYDDAKLDKKIALDKGSDKQLVEEILPGL